MGKTSQESIATVKLKDGNGECFIVELALDMSKIETAATALANKAQGAHRSYASACHGLVHAQVRKA